jgi:hypothetical protein
MKALAWAGAWYSKNKRDGERRHFLYYNGVIALFITRREAREFIDRQYGYIRTRRDLRIEPFGWRLPRAVKVTIAPK